MAESPLKIGFNVPFSEAIKAAQQRNVVLPDVYYGELQGLARQQAFSIAGLASLDQLTIVRNSLAAKLQSGQTFRQWQKDITESGTLDLPRHRLDNIFRTNIQSNYNRGRWERFVAVKDTQPYLMYDAINDSRVRPSHLAMDGIIRTVDDPFWHTHAPLNGYRCRCRLVALNERLAQARSGNGTGLNKGVDAQAMQPDKGFDYNPGEDLMAGIKQGIASRATTAPAKLVKALDAKISNMKKIEFTPQKTAKEAANWAVKNNLVDAADYTGIKADVANAFNQSLFEHIRDFPELRKNQEFIGTIQAQLSLFKEQEIKRYMGKLRTANPGWTDDALRPYAEKTVKLRKTDNRCAQSWMQPGVKGISVNKKWGADVDKYKSALMHAESVRWHPEGTGILKADPDHEFGHQLDALLGLSTNKEIESLFASFSLIKNKIELSEYALRDIGEFIAEGWSEFRNNANPNILSKKIGSIILKKYAELTNG